MAFLTNFLTNAGEETSEIEDTTTQGPSTSMGRGIFKTLMKEVRTPSPDPQQQREVQYSVFFELIYFKMEFISPIEFT